MTWLRSTSCHSANCCVEVQFFKSTYSGPHDDNCVEVASHCGEVWVRDSKDPDGPVLRFTDAEWVAFIAGAKGGEFDL